MVFGLFSKKKKEVTLVCKPLTQAVENAILNTVGPQALSSVAQTARHAFALSIDPKADIKDFIDLIESDEGLSSRVIKIANSVFFDRGKQAKTIEESVVTIGLSEIKNLLGATTLSQLFPSIHPYRANLWMHHVATAIAARNLAETFMPGSSGTAFLAGLTHDLGKLLLLQRAPDQFLQAVSQSEREGISYATAESQVFPFDHTEVGHLVADRWHFPPEVTKAIRLHHAPEALTDQVDPLTSIIATADLIVRVHGIGSPTHAKIQEMLQEDLTRAWQRWGVSPEATRSIVQTIKRIVDEEKDLYLSR